MITDEQLEKRADFLGYMDKDTALDTVPTSLLKTVRRRHILDRLRDARESLRLLESRRSVHLMAWCDIGECGCGADEINAELDAHIAHLKQLLGNGNV